MQHMGPHGRSEEVGTVAPMVVDHRARHREEGSDSRHGTRSNRVEEPGSGDDNRHDARRSHDRGVVHDDHSSHPAELRNRHRYDGVEESVNGVDRMGLRLGSNARVSCGYQVREYEWDKHQHSSGRWCL